MTYSDDVERLAKPGLVLALLTTALLITSESAAEPRHDICRDVGDSFAFGVSTYGSLRDWAPAAIEQGADFRFLYVYILNGGMDDPENFEEWYVRPMAEATIDAGATPVFTFYQLLDLGRAAGYSGSEPEVVQRALDDSSVMQTYFDNFIWLLRVAEDLPEPAIVHVEPDSWGFMMWAMGVEGNADPTTVSVRVASSGNADLADLPDDASGLGRALVRLRDLYGPSVRLGWHASNFRVGTRPEVVVDFFSQMGDWDVLIGEHFHYEDDEATWWEPWSTDRIDINIDWLTTVVDGTGLPFMFWQEPIGSPDWHLLGEDESRATLRRIVDGGGIAMMFEHIAHRGESDPDDIRASGDLGTTPPFGHEAGGTAADMRERVTAYASAPMRWTDGSICASGGTPPTDGGLDDGGPTDADIPDEDVDLDAGSGPDAPDASDGTPDDGDDGCSCSTVAPSRRGLLHRLVANLW